MRTIWHSLAWKEWHEQKWKLASIAAILCGIAVTAMLDPDRWSLDGVRVALVMGIVPLAVFVGLGTAAGERSRRTLSFLQALPVPMWRVALHKIGFGLASVFVPAILTVVLIYLWCRCLDFWEIDIDYGDLVRATMADPFTFGIENWFIDIAAMLMLISGSFFIWTIGPGVNRRDEVSAGAVSLAAMAGWWLFLAVAWELLFLWNQGNPDWQRGAGDWFTAVSLATVPGGVVKVAELSTGVSPYWVIGAFVAASTHLLLAAWYVARFGRLANREVRSPKVAVGERSDWLGAPWRWPLAAIVWKQCRESAPIVLAGLAGIVGIVALVAATEGPQKIGRLGEFYAGVAVFLGTLVALIAGIGVCFHDMEPQLNAFWRSRPIHPDLWFWSKFGTALALLVIGIYGPMFLIAGVGGMLELTGENSSESLLFPLMHIAVFAVAVALTCMVRNAVYAAILTIAALYLGVIVVWLVDVAIDLLRGLRFAPDDLFDLSIGHYIVALILDAVVGILIAWLAVRNDWGRKSRY